MGAEGMEGESGVVIEGICEDDMQNLSWRLVWILIRASITFGKVVVVAVCVMVVAVVGVMSFFEKTLFISDEGRGRVFKGESWTGGMLKVDDLEPEVG